MKFYMDFATNLLGVFPRYQPGLFNYVTSPATHTRNARNGLTFNPITLGSLSIWAIV